MRVSYSKRARSDLLSIFEHLAKSSPSGATNVMTAIYAAISFVERNPQAAPAATVPNVRVKVVQKYNFKVFYRVIDDGNGVEIVHVRHMARRPWRGE